MSSADTIYALATPAGVSGVAVIRVSGQETKAIIKALCGNVKPRYASLRKLIYKGDVLDEALVFYFPAPHSFTGEDVVEFQLHGSLAVIDSMFKVLSALGARPAFAGEFTRRAFANGQLDLTQVEGLADLLAAHTDRQRKTSLSQLGGALSKAAERFRNDLMHILALLEATLDFPDEEDVTVQAVYDAKALMVIVSQKLQTLLEESPKGRVQRDGLVITLLGAPNAGKSALLNYFAGEEMAIVSPVAGTTRDPIICELVIKGVPVRLIDTAGLRESADGIENEGMKRTRAWAEKADLIWHLADLRFASETNYKDAWLIGTKLDLASKNISYHHNLSSKTGEGCDALTLALEHWVSSYISGEPALLVRERHVVLLKEVYLAIETALAYDFERLPDLVAEEVRIALRAIGRLTGHVGVEEMLDKLFLEFCIGK
jgi:tRNA modification GTPase